MLSRRALLTGMGFVTGASILTPISSSARTFSEHSTLEIVERELTYPNLQEDLVGFKIGFLSDFHLGGWVASELVVQSIEAVAQRGVDVLVLGGDHIWVSEAPGGLSSIVNSDFVGGEDVAVATKVFEALCDFLTPYKEQFPIISVLGNHDRWSSFDSYSILTKAGITISQNDSFYIKRGASTIRVYGTEDLWTGVPKPPLNINPSEFLILATHNPDYASYLYHRVGIPFNLALSGHTHGGQIKLPIIGAPFYNVRDLRYAEGLVDYGDTKFYTTRGVGVVELPLRINCPPEATILKLQRA